MLRRTVPFVVVLVLVAGFAFAAEPAAPAADGTLTATISFPAGNPEAGRLVFRTHKCFACHQVAGPEGQGIKTRTSVSAPLLDSRIAQKEPGEVITGIIAPSHKVSESIAKESGGKLSPMGDFNATLTVRDLIDLVAYLRSIDETQPSGRR
jgi:mono/diheme cytochrome c family protein